MNTHVSSEGFVCFLFGKDRWNEKYPAVRFAGLEQTVFSKGLFAAF